MSDDTGKTAEKTPDASNDSDGLDTSIDARGSARIAARSRVTGISAGIRSLGLMDKDVLDAYNMNHGTRGHALIFNHENFHWSVGMNRRAGTQIDADNLNDRFRELGFTTHVHQDVSTVRVREIIFEAARADHSNYDAFICVFLSHGDDGIIYAHDGVLRLQDLMNQFRGDVCPSLAGKPKIFFIQACRGDQHEIGVDAPDEPDSGPMPDERMTVADAGTQPTIPAGADFLVAYSVTQGYFSHRDTHYGSWFVQALSYILATYGNELEICEMLSMVNRMVSQRQVERAVDQEMIGKKQVPCFLSMLTKKLYFPRKVHHT
ncbi:caspase-6-like [Saccoglossus kowalevskii]|uniref:Caspase-6 n=1 Tax=Saccoglossus kowalevskii TaxID=10224 RepID=A0ABM0GTW7_SACKO|nr:PREDICTED: caspase-6-like [Saccoglossus kowalevskii]